MTAPSTTTRTIWQSLKGSDLRGFTSNGIRLDDVLFSDETGQTYLATKMDTGRSVHVWIADQRFSADETFFDRFRLESDQLVNLRHLYIACCLEHWEWIGPNKERILALVNEAITGMPLAALCQQDRMSVRDVLLICNQAAEGLAAAHLLGIIHGDLTNRALIISEGGFTKVQGFSLGRADYCIAGNERRILASPESMAPEVCRGQAPNSSSDIYSLGVILYQALMGEVPFPAMNALESLHLQNTGEIPSISKQLSGGEELDHLVKRMLAKDAKDRPASMSEVAKELLALGSKIPGTLRCLAPLPPTSLSLSALVKKGLHKELNQGKGSGPAEVPVEKIDQSKPDTSSAKQTQTGGTTTISRTSTEYFANPDLFKPTGVTPAIGNPIVQPSLPKIETSTIKKPSTQRINQKTEVAIKVAQPQEKAPTDRREKNPVTSSQVKGADSINKTMTNQPWFLPVFGFSTVILIGGSVWLFLSINAATPKEQLDNKANVTQTSDIAVDLLSRSATELENKIVAIEEIAAADPTQALTLADQLRKLHPREDLSRLPLPLRLELEGPTWEMVEIITDGIVVPRPKKAVICRWSHRSMIVRISAPGFIPLDVEIPANASTFEKVQPVRLANKPLWQLSPIALTWVAIFSHSANVVVASDQKIVLIDPQNGQEIQRLDQKIISDLPPDRIGWIPVSTGNTRQALFSTTAGICAEVSEKPALSATIVHRGERAVYAFVQAPMPLRLNDIGTFTIEKKTGAYWLCADAPDRRLWTKALAGMLQPTLAAVGDQLVLCLDNMILIVDHEGMPAQEIPLPSQRTNMSVWIEPGRKLLIPTRDGVRALFVNEHGQWKLNPQPIVSGHIAALSYGNNEVFGELVVVSGVTVQLLTIKEGTSDVRWQQALPTTGQIKHLGSDNANLFLTDNIGNIFTLNKEGMLTNQLRLHSPAIAAPYQQGNLLITTEASGVISGFSFR